MKRGKLIHLAAHEPVGLSAKYEQPWSDTYAWYSKRRKKARLAPCICGMANLRFDIEINDHCLADAKVGRGIEITRSTVDGVIDYKTEEVMRPVDDGLVETFTRDGANLAIALYETEAGRHYADAARDDTMPNIYVPHEIVNRQIIEKAIAWWLTRSGVAERFRFKWQRVKGGVVCPM